MLASSMVDHLVYGVFDLDAGVADLEHRLGVRAAAGGKHVGRGTHNALLGLGGQAYLEISAPDPEQKPVGALPFSLETLTRPRLVAWAIRVSGIDAFIERARRGGYDPGEAREMDRVQPDGVRLAWRLAQEAPGGRSFLVPFLIDWLDTPHPAASAPAGVTLAELSGVHPEPESVRPALEALGAGLTVVEGPDPALVAALDTPRGRVELR
jgi:hypothetical protein